ncbi:MAG TPA: DNA mismatch repair protein MutS, partial [Nitrospirales bacterium]|nr:DNA mismatch repair protein MutS [Nitrospirales bacterium]
MQQYKDLKADHQDSILFFRVGDFYEMFYDDAVYASKILDIALTSRDKNKADRVPLCGFPYHAASTYISKLLKGGHKVALCEQTEDAKLVKDKRPVRREVVRVYTPGTLVESELLATHENNYLAALAPERDRVGLAYLDLSTGEFRATELVGHDLSHAVMDELTRIDPR